MIEKNIKLVMRIFGALVVLSGLNLLFFIRSMIEFSGLPDITPTLYPRVVGALMIGLGYIGWMVGDDPQGLRRVIPGIVIGAGIGSAVVLANIYISQIRLPAPLGVPAAIMLTIAEAVMLALLALMGLYWWNTRQKA